MNNSKMKESKFNFATQFRYYVLILFLLVSIEPSAIAQVTGRLSEEARNEPVAFATIAIYKLNDSTFVDAVTSDTAGYFSFRKAKSGSYRLIISMIGFEKFVKNVEVPASGYADMGTLYLREVAYSLGEAVVAGERLRGKTEKDKTTYYVTRKMSDVSGNGLDIIKFIPGIRVDLQRNISLDGSGNILILVDGNERDKDFVSQIPVDMIDRVEIINSSLSRYDATVSGVINIILRKEQKSGISGQLNSELPLSGSVYLHPDFNLSYSNKKLNALLSYNGEILRLDQAEKMIKNVNTAEALQEITSSQYIEQRTWSNKFHYGVEYRFDSLSQAGIYGYYDRFSQKYDGTAGILNSLCADSSWTAARSDHNLSNNYLCSVFFKHKFPGNSSFDIDIYNFSHSGRNISEYQTEFPAEPIWNKSLPMMNALRTKADYSSPLGSSLNLTTGFSLYSQLMKDGMEPTFHFSERVYSAYSSIAGHQGGMEWSVGLRLEKSFSSLRESFTKSCFSLLPSAAVNIKLRKDQSLRISYGKSIRRPAIYQLNPIISRDDPYSVHSGNPGLQPEIVNTVFLDYSRRINNNFISGRIFYNRNSDVISNLTMIRNNRLFETHFHNLGTIHQAGLQFSGTFKAGKVFSFMPFLRIYDNYSLGNRLAVEAGVGNKNQVVFEPGFSAIASFKHDINLSANLQYSSPRNSIQWNSFSDALYLISIEKTFKDHFKASVVSGLPLRRRFIYQGNELIETGFSSRYTGEILLPRFFGWLKLSYQFSSGKKHEKLNRAAEEIRTSDR